MVLEINLNNVDKVSSSKKIYDMIVSSFKDNPFAGFLVYLADNNIAGYLYYSDIYDRIEINQIMVFDEFKRNGYASEMLQYLIRKNKNISLEVRCDNIPAINLYKKFGFKKVAVRTGYYDGVDGNLMILEMK